MSSRERRPSGLQRAGGPPDLPDYGGRQTIDARLRVRSALQPVPGLEEPAQKRQADDEEHEDRGEARDDRHVGGAVEAPAEAADQVNDRVEQAEGAPRGR